MHTAIPEGEVVALERPTLDSLLAHHKKYGLDITHKATKRYTPRYKSWKELAKDSIVEVGIRYLNQEAFVLLIEGIGYSGFREEARTGWTTWRDNLDA